MADDAAHIGYFTRIALEDPETTGKHFSIEDGKLVKKTVGHINRAIADVLPLTNLSGFAEALKGTEPGRHVFTYGVPSGGESSFFLVSQAIYDGTEDKEYMICRSEDFFHWAPGAGIILFDYDPEGDALSREAWHTALCKVCPALAHVQALWWCSGSSFVCDPLETIQTGLRGQRMYLVAEDASDIPRAMKVFFARLWIAGEGHILINSAGAMLERGIIDPTVWQASRVDYVAGAVCAPGLVQDRGEPVLINPDGAVTIDTKAAFPDLTVDEVQAHRKAVAAAKEALKVEADGVHENWLADRAFDMAQAELGDVGDQQLADRAVEILLDKQDMLSRAAHGDSPALPIDHVIHLTDGRKVTIREMLERPSDFDGVKGADPIEPDYGGGRQTCIVYPRSRRIVSQAHGLNTVYAMGGEDEWQAFWEKKCSIARGRWLSIVGDIEDVLAPDVIDDFISLDGNEQAQERILEIAKAQRKKTAFTSEANRRRKQINSQPVTENVTADPQPGDRTRFDVSDPNTANDDVQRIEDLLAARHLAFSYGGNAVMIRMLRSSYATITLRNDDGSVTVDEEGEPVRIPAITAQAQTIRSGEASHLALKVGYFYEPTKSGSNPVPVPASISSIMTATLGSRLPVLKSIASHPVWWGGRLLTGNGVYHEKSGLWLQAGDTPPVQEWTDPGEAFRFLKNEWLSDFPFASDLDLINALCFLLTLITSKTMNTSEAGPPAFIVTAPSAGTGKSLLVSVLAMALLGSPLPSSTYPPTEEEREKVATTAIMEGAAALYFDNVKSMSTLGASHATLMKLVTDIVWRGRILGVSKTYSGPANFPVVMTGNNLVVTGAELPPRCLEIRLVAPSGQNLATREFRHDNIMQWTKDNRGRILGACASILSVGSNEKLYGRFPGWARTVALPLIEVSGVEGFFDAWIAAGDESETGHHLDGMPALLGEISHRLNLPKDGKWLTSAELLDAGPDHMWAKVNFGEPVTDARSVHRIMRAQADVLIPPGYRIGIAKANLGERTSRKVRDIYNITRITDQPVRDAYETKLERAAKVVELNRHKDD